MLEQGSPRGLDTPTVPTMSKHSGNPKVLAIVLAGGEGKRLMPLTADRAKPAVPFGGIYRLIDFALSNVVELRLPARSSCSPSTSRTAWTGTSPRRGGCRRCSATTSPRCPAQQRIDKSWYLGSADAIYQSLNLVHDEKPDIVVVVGADHVYRMDFCQMVRQHIETGAGVTVAAIRQPIALADQFGVIEVDGDDPRKIRAFAREAQGRQGPARLPRRGAGLDGQLRLRRRRAGRRGDPRRRARGQQARHGRRHRARLRRPRRGLRLRLQGQRRSPASPERDQRLLARRRHDRLLLRGAHGPRRRSTRSSTSTTTSGRSTPTTARYPPAKFVQGSQEAKSARRTTRPSPPASWSAAPAVTNSVLSPRCHIHSFAEIADSVLLDGVDVGRNAIVQAGHPRQERPGPRGRQHRRRPGGRPGPRLPS